MSWIMSPLPGLAEPFAAPEFYADNVGAIELVGQNFRVYYYALQTMIDGGARPAPIVVAKVLRPRDSIPGIIERLGRCLADGGDPPLKFPRLVR